MSLGSNSLRDKIVPGSSSPREPSDAVVAALEGELEDGEEIKHRIPGKNGIVREHDGQTETIEKPANGQSLVLVTDRKVLFVLAGPDRNGVRSIEYTNVRSVDANNGLLRSKLTLKVWGDGEYRFKVSDSDALGAAVSYVESASNCWQRVVSAVEEATEHTKQMGESLEEGSLDSADESRERAIDKLNRARTYLGGSEIESPKALVDRVETAAVEHQRTEIRNRLTRAETLITEGRYQADARQYTGAYQSYTDAREHLETAQSLAAEIDIPEPPAIESKLETIDNRLRHLTVRPLALAKQACERAEGTGKLTVEVEAWQEAFEHYRDALTAGWGTELGFHGDRAEIQTRIEQIVGTLIRKRSELATQHEQDGDRYSQTDPERAIEAYEAAIEQLEQARQLAAEFRAGDYEKIDGQIDWISAKRLDLR